MATRRPIVVFLTSGNATSGDETFIVQYDVRLGAQSRFQASLGSSAALRSIDVSSGRWFDQFVATGIAADFCFICPGDDDFDDDAKAFRQLMQQRLQDGLDTVAEHEALMETWSQSFDFVACVYDYCLGEGGSGGIMTQVGNIVCDTLVISLQPISKLNAIVTRMKLSQAQPPARSERPMNEGNDNGEIEFHSSWCVVRPQDALSLTRSSYAHM